MLIYNDVQYLDNTEENPDEKKVIATGFVSFQ